MEKLRKEVEFQRKRAEKAESLIRLSQIKKDGVPVQEMSEPEAQYDTNKVDEDIRVSWQIMDNPQDKAVTPKADRKSLESENLRRDSSKQKTIGENQVEPH